MNSEDTVNGITVEQTAHGTSALAEGGSDVSSNDDLTVLECQPDSVYDLFIHNQTLLWKALPKPSYSNRVKNSNKWCLKSPSTRDGPLQRKFSRQSVALVQ